MLEKKQILLLSGLSGVLGVLCAALFHFLSSDRTPPTTPQPAPQVQATPSPIPTERPEPPPVFKPADPQGFIAPPSQNIAEIPPDIGAPARVVAGAQNLLTNALGKALHVRIVSEARCMISDMDIIREELRHSSSRRLLFSIESLVRDSGFEDQSILVTGGQLERGFDQSFRLPRYGGPFHLGVFICKDDDMASRCSGKPAQKMDRLYNRYFPSVGKSGVAPEEKASDKLYFFQYVIIKGESLYIIESDLKSQDYQNLVKFLTPLVLNPSDALNIVRRVRKWNNTLLSATASRVGSSISINLPHLELGNCQVSGPKPLFSLPDQNATPMVDIAKPIEARSLGENGQETGASDLPDISEMEDR